MNPVQKKYISQNLEKLTENTTNTRRLFIYLDAFNLLALAERQVLLSFPDDRSRIQEMYNVLVQKDMDNYDKIIQCLELTGNAKAANILANAYPLENHQNGHRNSTFNAINIDDFQVRSNHVPIIVEILESLEISSYDWSRFTVNLLEQNSTDLKNLPTPSTAFKMMRTLDAWLEQEGSNATFSLLLTKISTIQKTAAEILLTSKDDILEAE